MIRALAVALIAAVSVWPVQPPFAPIRPVVDTYPNGMTVSDPYRYMENMKTPEMQAYFRSQAGYTNAVLARLGPGRRTLSRDVARFVNAGASVFGLAVVPGKLFYQLRPVGATTDDSWCKLARPRRACSSIRMHSANNSV